MRSAYVDRLKILVEEALGVLAHLTERGIIPLLRPPRPPFGKNAFAAGYWSAGPITNPLFKQGGENVQDP